MVQDFKVWFERDEGFSSLGGSRFLVLGYWLGLGQELESWAWTSRGYLLGSLRSGRVLSLVKV